MKKSYKLLGLIYDNLDECKECIKQIEYNDNIFHYEIESTLFDVNGKVRKIMLSELFSIENNVQLEKALIKIKTCRKIVIEIDLCSEIKIVQDFIDKRLKQIVFLLRQNTALDIMLMKKIKKN